MKSVGLPVQTSLELLNIKVQIDTLLFDMLLDNTFTPQHLEVGTEKHNHSTFEIQFIVSGSGTLMISENEYPIEPGSLHLIGPHIFHSIQPSCSDPITRLSIRFTFQELFPHSPWYPLTETEQMKSALTHVNYHHFSNTDNNQKIFLLLEEIRSEIGEPSVGSYTNIHSLFAQLIVHLVRSICITSHTAIPYTLPSKVKDELRTRIIDTFFSRYKENLRIDMLAIHLNLSVKQANRLVQQYFNTSFKQKLIDTRVEVAKDLLRTSKLPIQRIAEEVGYTTTQHFGHIFMQRTGLMPTQYRQLHRERDLSRHSVQTVSPPHYM